MCVRALFAAPEQTFAPEHFTAKWSRNVHKGGKATLTVKTSADVETIHVDDVTIDSYKVRTERSGWGSSAKKMTYHVFTYTVTATATADYTVCAVNADGAVSDPITARLTVRPSIRDWWHDISASGSTKRGVIERMKKTYVKPEVYFESFELECQHRR